jgi:hypothetical protein
VTSLNAHVLEPSKARELRRRLILHEKAIRRFGDDGEAVPLIEGFGGV